MSLGGSKSLYSSSIKLIKSLSLFFENESTKYKLYPSFVIFNALFILAKASSYSDTLFDFSIFLSIDKFSKLPNKKSSYVFHLKSLKLF